MAEQNERPQPTGDKARPLKEAELDKAAGGKRGEVKDAKDKYANTGNPY